MSLLNKNYTSLITYFLVYTFKAPLSKLNKQCEQMNEDVLNYLNTIRRDFSGKPLNLKNMDKDPIRQYTHWFEEAVDAQELDPMAMSLTTVNENKQPSTRIVYMRGIHEEGFVFYTNYNSAKAQEIDAAGRSVWNFGTAGFVIGQFRHLAGV